jgi:hypothetical protein
MATALLTLENCIYEIVNNGKNIIFPKEIESFSNILIDKEKILNEYDFNKFGYIPSLENQSLKTIIQHNTEFNEYPNYCLRSIIANLIQNEFSNYYQSIFDKNINDHKYIPDAEYLGTQYHNFVYNKTMLEVIQHFKLNFNYNHYINDLVFLTDLLYKYSDYEKVNN